MLGDLMGSTTMTRLGICRVWDHPTSPGLATTHEGFYPILIIVVPPFHSTAACCPVMALSITLPRRYVRKYIQPRFSAPGSAMYCP